MSGAKLLAERVASLPDAIRRLGAAPNTPVGLGSGSIQIGRAHV